MILRGLLSATFLLVAYKLFLFAGQTDNLWFYLAASAFALASIDSTARILLTYRKGKRQ